MAKSASKYHYAEMAHQYAIDVVAGDVPACKWIRLAAKRHLDDLERSKDPNYPYYFDAAAGDAICVFISLMCHVKGKWAGKPIMIEPWQAFALVPAWGWMRRSDKTRRYREFFLLVPRKNGKSLIAAGIGNFMFSADAEPGAEVYSVATSEKQAWETFGPARLMALNNQEYREAFGIHVGAKSISVLNTASKFEPVIGNPGDGSSPHCALNDEYHEQKDSRSYDTMKTGMGARMQPMMVTTTTAGTDTSGPCYSKQLELQKVLEGVIDNPELWGLIFTLDEDDDWKDFSVWGKANPNIGVSVSEDFLRARHREAMQSAERQNIIRCKHLNIWSNAAVGWINMAKWDACGDASLKMEDFKDCECWLGVDLASKIDLAAMMLLFRIPANHKFSRFVKSNYVLFGKYYLPEETIEKPENAHWRQWRDMGLLTQTPGARTDFTYLEDDLKRLSGRFDLIDTHDAEDISEKQPGYLIQELAYDPREAEYLMQNIRNWASFECIEVPQGPAAISEPMKEFEGLYLSGKLKHDGCPLLKWQASNVIRRNSKNKSYYPAKERDANKIDGIVAAIMALSRAMVAPEPNVYEERRSFVWL